MSFIQFQCYACNQVLKVGADKAGKKAKCIKCGTILTIPVESTAPVPAPAAKAPPAPSKPARPAPPPIEELEEEPIAELEEEPMEELEELPPEPRRSRLIEDDEPRSRRGKGRSDDDYDDRPRSKRRDDEDDYDDRPRGKRRDDVDDYDDDDDDGPRRKNPKAAWAKVKLGFLLVFIGVCVTSGALLLGVIGQLLDTILLIQFLTGARAPSGYNGTLLFRIAEPIFLCGDITLLVGYVFLMLGPNKRGSMGLSIATLAVAAIHLLLVLIIILPSLYTGTFLMGAAWRFYPGMGYSSLGEFGGWFAQLLIHLLYTAQFILGALVLGALANAGKNKDLAGQSIGLLSLAGAFAGVGLVTAIIMHVTRGSSPAMAWVFLTFQWLTAGAFVGFVIWYAMALWSARELPNKR